METNQFLTESLRISPSGEDIARILAAAVSAVEPGAAVRRFMHRQNKHLEMNGQSYNLDNFRRVRIIGAGKAGAPMASAAADILGNYLGDSLVIVKQGYHGCDDGRINLLEAGHPIPDERGVQASTKLRSFLTDGQPNDLLICLLSGGGSALLVSPAPGLELADLQALTQVLLISGVSIQEINTLRKHLETLKGGNLARLAFPAALVALVLSDVVGDPLDVIASGPTVPDPSNFADAYAILERYEISGRIPPVCLAYLQAGLRGEIQETPKPGDMAFERVQNLIIGSNRLALQAAQEQSRRAGFDTLLLTSWLQGEARQVGRLLASIGREMALSGQPLSRPGCILAGGETTVTVTGDGMGGRNQELALGAVMELDGLQNTLLVSLASDGGDGPTNAAGAVVTGQTMARARALGMHPMDYLKHNDAYHFFAALGDLLMPGPTMTNVNDLSMVITL